MNGTKPVVSSRSIIYFAMIIMLIVVLYGAYGNADPILLAVGLIGELILVSTAHLSWAIEHFGTPRGTR